MEDSDSKAQRSAATNRENDSLWNHLPHKICKCLYQVYQWLQQLQNFPIYYEPGGGGGGVEEQSKLKELMRDTKPAKQPF
mgnify:CR=1 FL=1